MQKKNNDKIEMIKYANTHTYTKKWKRRKKGEYTHTHTQTDKQQQQQRTALFTRSKKTTELEKLLLPINESFFRILWKKLVSLCVRQPNLFMKDDILIILL